MSWGRAHAPGRCPPARCQGKDVRRLCVLWSLVASASTPTSRFAGGRGPCPSKATQLISLGSALKMASAPRTTAPRRTAPGSSHCLDPLCLLQAGWGQGVPTSFQGLAPHRRASKSMSALRSACPGVSSGCTKVCSLMPLRRHRMLFTRPQRSRAASSCIHTV